MRVTLELDGLDISILKESLGLYGEQNAVAKHWANGLTEHLNTRVKESQLNDSQLIIYVVTHTDTNKIYYCGTESVEANRYLENPHLSKKAAEKYILSIYNGEGRLLNTDIRKRIDVK